ncbi:MAG: tRNA pseudouridine(55) synthase TruB [Tenericutes bacterium HGW-Tenericutes-3]|nr:MAG: tRNA pseudouridine(55) synthase TruB [Tenericutes bacterium HGW-Tenericutes-3]
MDGFLLINKPKGLTSHDVVFKIKKKFHLDKVGHTGTLDPFASGLMILCLGKATKLASLFSDLDKAYEGTIVFGNHYDTYDTTGQIEKTKIIELKKEEISTQMNTFIGVYDQLPPMYSAIKKNGQKLYDLARQGLDVERDTRSVEIYRFVLNQYLSPLTCTFSVDVSKGTYIRSLVVDLAEKLDTFAALETLNRTRVGSYDLMHAKNIEDVTKNDMISLKEFFKEYPSVVLNDYLIKLVKNGVYLDERQIVIDQPFIVYDEQNEMIAYYEVKSKNQYKPVLIF